MHRLDGKVTLKAGASIGRGIARGLAPERVDLVLAAPELTQLSRDQLLVGEG